MKSRLKKKLTEKSSWYKKKPKGIGGPVKSRNKSVGRNNNDGPKVISVMFVAKTPGSGLANRLKEVARNYQR